MKGSEVLQLAVERLAMRMAGVRDPKPRPAREPWLHRWFGTVLPVGLHLWWRRRKKDKPHAAGS